VQSESVEGWGQKWRCRYSVLARGTKASKHASCPKRSRSPHHYDHLLSRDQKDHVPRLNKSRACPFAFGSCFGFLTLALVLLRCAEAPRDPADGAVAVRGERCPPPGQYLILQITIAFSSSYRARSVICVLVPPLIS
jgi:hypothetical protein